MIGQMGAISGIEIGQSASRLHLFMMSQYLISGLMLRSHGPPLQRLRIRSTGRSPSPCLALGPIHLMLHLRRLLWPHT